MKPTRKLVMLLASLLVITVPVATAADRPEWNQKKAEKIVGAVLDQEKNGDFAWDKIAWHTDAEKVAKFAAKQGKPIFVYLYLKKDVGPKAAPC